MLKRKLTKQLYVGTDEEGKPTVLTREVKDNSSIVDSEGPPSSKRQRKAVVATIEQSTTNNLARLEDLTVKQHRKAIVAAEKATREIKEQRKRKYILI